MTKNLKPVYFFYSTYMSHHQIRLTKGLYALVDEIDFDYISSFKWCASFDNRTKYYAKRRCKDKFVRMHREIAVRVYGPIPNGYVVDHINHNSLDNRRCNLQIITQSENVKRMYR